MARAHPETRARLVRSAQELMLAKGYGATSVDDICSRARLTKGSFFHYFESKEKLALAALDGFAGAGFEVIRQAPFQRKKDPLERVLGYVDFMIEMSQNPSGPDSCLVGNLAQEVSDTHPALRDRCALLFGTWADGLRKELEAARKSHPSGRAFDPGSLADHFLAVFEGALILAKAKNDRSVVRDQLLHYKNYVRRLFTGATKRKGGKP